jgi:hypothetical protein
VRILVSRIGAASQTVVEIAVLKSNMIWDVHGCPGCSVTLPTPSKREPVREAFAVVVGFFGSAQLAKMAATARTPNERKPGLTARLLRLNFSNVEAFSINSALSIDW